MGSEFEFNYILKLDKKNLENLSVGYEICFSKKGRRIYPDLPFLFVDEDWNAYGYGAVKEKSEKNMQEETSTTGIFEILYLFDENERKAHSDVLKFFYHQSSFGKFRDL
jgi:hypothetical protein